MEVLEHFGTNTRYSSKFSLSDFLGHFDLKHILENI